MQYTIELYKADGMFCAYIGQDCGSGYEIRECTESECARRVAAFLENNGYWTEEE